MEFGKKIIIGALCLVIGGEYALYKNFENSPNTLQEMAKWPFNEIYVRNEKLWNEHNVIKKVPLKTTINYVTEIKKIESVYGPDISLIKLEDGKRFVYGGDILAMKEDKVNFNFLSIKEIKKRNEFIEKVIKFRKQDYMFRSFTIGMDSYPYPNINMIVKNIQPERLNDLDGIVEDYEIVK